MMIQRGPPPGWRRGTERMVVSTKVKVRSQWNWVFNARVILLHATVLRYHYVAVHVPSG